MIPSQLPVFLCVVQQGSFSAASRKLGISPAAVSKSVSQLEKQLNQRLFHRSTHSLSLTGEGHTLYDRTAELVEELDENIRLSMESTTALRGQIKVNLPNHFGLTVVYPALLAFQEANPEVELDLHFDDRVINLVEGGFDIGIGNRLNDDSRLIARQYMEMEIVCLCSCAYAESHGVPATPAELENHQCILYRAPASGRVLPWNFSEGGRPLQVTPPHRLVVNSPVAAFRAAEEGHGIACVGHTHLLEAAGGMQMVLEEWRPAASTVWLYYPSRSFLPERVRKLIAFLLEARGERG